MPMSESGLVLHTITVKPDFENIICQLRSQKNVLFNRESNLVAVCFELKKNDSPDNAAEHSLSALAVLSKATLLSEYQNDRARAAVASTVSYAIKSNFVVDHSPHSWGLGLRPFAKYIP